MRQSSGCRLVIAIITVPGWIWLAGFGYLNFKVTQFESQFDSQFFKSQLDSQDETQKHHFKVAFKPR